MKTMCPPGYYHNGLAATHLLGHMIYAPGDNHCGDNGEGTLFSGLQICMLLLYICI